MRTDRKRLLLQGILRDRASIDTQSRRFTADCTCLTIADHSSASVHRVSPLMPVNSSSIPSLFHSSVPLAAVNRDARLHQDLLAVETPYTFLTLHAPTSPGRVVHP